MSHNIPAGGTARDYYDEVYGPSASEECDCEGGWVCCGQPAETSDCYGRQGFICCCAYSPCRKCNPFPSSSGGPE